MTGAKAEVLGYKAEALACLEIASSLGHLESPAVPGLRHKAKDAYSWAPDWVVTSGQAATE